MPRYPRRFQDTSDFFDPEFRRFSAASERPSAMSGGVAGGSPPVRSREPRLAASVATRLTSKKETNRALDPQSVANNNVTPSGGKMRVHDQALFGHKDISFDVRRGQAISAALAKHSAQAANVAQRSHAKALAADRRMFNPTSGPKTIYGTQASVKANTLARFRFAFPQLVVPCVQRKTRKEVLFAQKKAGGASSRRPKRRGPYSGIGC